MAHKCFEPMRDVTIVNRDHVYAECQDVHQVNKEKLEAIGRVLILEHFVEPATVSDVAEALGVCQESVREFINKAKIVKGRYDEDRDGDYIYTMMKVDGNRSLYALTDEGRKVLENLKETRNSLERSVVLTEK